MTRTKTRRWDSRSMVMKKPDENSKWLQARIQIKVIISTPSRQYLRSSHGLAIYSPPKVVDYLSKSLLSTNTSIARLLSPKTTITRIPRAPLLLRYPLINLGLSFYKATQTSRTNPTHIHTHTSLHTGSYRSQWVGHTTEHSTGLRVTNTFHCLHMQSLFSTSSHRIVSSSHGPPSSHRKVPSTYTL